MSPRDVETLQYKCNLMPLTPIQIGSGNEISPFEYVIKNNEYFRIDINEVIEKFPLNIKKEYIKTLEEKSMFSSRKFLKNYYKKEYGFIYKCPISEDFIKLYDEKIGGSKNKNEDNQLTIFEFIGNYKGKYIPGSTLKGAIRSAYLMENFTSDDFYKITREIKNSRGRKNPTKPFKSVLNKNIVMRKIESRILELEEFDPKFDPFKNFKISDTKINNDLIEVKQIFRKGIKKEKCILMPMGCFEVTKSVFGSNESIELEFEINIKNIFGDTEEKIIKLSKRKSVSIVKESTAFYLEDKGILEYLNNKSEKVLKEDIEFFEKIGDKKLLDICQKLLAYREKLDENQALIRIGRGIGFNSTTLNLCNEKKESVFTRVTVDDMPIGWALITCKENL